MPRAMRICTVPGCPEIVASGRCAAHRSAANKARGSYEHRGGGNAAAWRRARARCLTRDPLCTCRDTGHGHRDPCGAIATVADHHPVTKRDLVAQGVRDPDAIHRLRGLCHLCHAKHTARTSPGGWNAR